MNAVCRLGSLLAVLAASGSCLWAGDLREPVRDPLRPAGRPSLAPLPSGSALVVEIAGALSLPPGLTPDDAARIQQLVVTLRSGDARVGKAQWADLVERLRGRNAGIDIMAVLYAVMKAAILDQNEDMRYYAEKLRHHNQINEALRAQLADLKSKSAELAAADKRGQPLKVTVRAIGALPAFRAGQPPLLAPRSQVVDSARLRELVTQTEDKLRTVGDDAQLASIDLQNILQKQQQVVQTLSNIAKMLHDTAMSIIRKMGD